MRITREDAIYLVAALLISYFFVAVVIFFTFVTGFVDEFPALKIPLLAPHESVLRLQWVFNFTLMGIGLFFVWRNGFKHSTVQLAISLNFLQLAMAAIWPFTFSGLDSSVASISVIVSYVVLLFWTINIFRKVSELAALVVTPVLMGRAINVYFVVHAILLNPENYRLF